MPRRYPAQASRIIDLALALALGILAAVLRPPDWELAKALWPRPDALEYAVSASNLAAGQGFNLRLGDERHPPRYELGYPLLLAAWYRATGGKIESAAALNPLLSTLGILLLFAAARRCFGRSAAVVATLLLVLSRLQIESGRPIMSESFSFLLGCALLCTAARASLPGWRWLIAGLLAGSLGAIRPIHWPGILIATAAATLVQRKGRAAIAYLAGVILVLVPLLAERWIRLGAIWTSGYSYWLTNQPPDFSLGYLFRTPQGPGTLSFYAARLAPWDSAWAYGAIALAAIGLYAAARPRSSAAIAFWLSAAVLALPTAGFVFYFFLERRYLVPALPFLCWCSAAGLDWLIARSATGRWTGALLGSAAIVQAGWGALSLPAPSRDALSGELDGLRAASQRVQAGELLIVDTSAALAAWEVPQARIVLLRPWLDEHYIRLAARRIEPGAAIPAELGLTPILFTTGQNPFPPTLKLLRRAWRQNRPVLLLLTGRRDELRRLARLRIWELQVLERGALWVLARVTPNRRPRGAAAGPDSDRTARSADSHR